MFGQLADDMDDEWLFRRTTRCDRVTCVVRCEAANAPPATARATTIAATIEITLRGVTSLLPSWIRSGHESTFGGELGANPPFRGRWIRSSRSASSTGAEQSYRACMRKLQVLGIASGLVALGSGLYLLQHS